MSAPTPDGSDRPAGDAEEHAPRVVRPRAPEQTRDDTDEGWGDWRDQEDRDRWILEQRPPHWD